MQIFGYAFQFQTMTPFIRFSPWQPSRDFSPLCLLLPLPCNVCRLCNPHCWYWLVVVGLGFGLPVSQSVSDNDTSDASSFLNRFDGVKCAGVLFGLEYWWSDTRISRLGTVGNKNEWTEDNIGSWINSNNAKRKQKSKKRRSIKSRTSPGSPPDELTFYISTTWSGVGIIVTTTTCWSFHLIVSCL